MLQAARQAARALGDSAPLVRRYLLRQQLEDGAFRDRSGRGDLYYTVFGLDGLRALETAGANDGDSFRKAAAYVRKAGEGDGLDFVHLCCLARARIQTRSPQPVRGAAGWDPAALAERIESFRSGDGGYGPIPGSPHGTVYGCFLALAAYQDLGLMPPHPGGLLECLRRLATTDGAWSNALPEDAADHPQRFEGSTNATAAAVAVLRQLNQPAPAAALDWLLARCPPEGGFRAAPGAPLPDLLSTATALHALGIAGAPLDGVRERCLDFLDSLWTNEGSFHAHWAEDTLDSEYTFYGLLALGRLQTG